MNYSHDIRVAVLVDLPRSPKSGGQVKCWERWAHALAKNNLPLNLTVYFSGNAPDEILSPKVRFRHLPPVFSTTNFRFLSHIPDNTDLANYHNKLAHELKQYDVIHTTDAYFAFARTAEHVSRKLKIPLTTSFHTDTPRYTSIYTRQTIEHFLNFWPWAMHMLNDVIKIPARLETCMIKKLKKHIRHCSQAMVTRKEDQCLAESILGSRRVHHLRLGIDKKLYGQAVVSRSEFLAQNHIPSEPTVMLFVGRVDEGKNIFTLTYAIQKLIADGYSLHLVVAGLGPETEAVKKALGSHVSMMGFVDQTTLAKLYATVDVLCVPSEIEMRSMACVEAIQSGCPVIVSHKSEIFELFNYTDAMLPVESGVDNWVQALKDFYSDKEKQNHMHNAATAYALQYLGSWNEILEQDIFPSWDEAFNQSQITSK
jgi:glycosyltransferase involved in cell wall biosynthesis